VTRLLALALAFSASAAPAACARTTGPPAGGDRTEARNLDSARELDRQGVRSFREGHFADAVRYFLASFERGGPSSELWNVARCEEHLDDPDAAVAALERYLSRPDLSATDRADARREAEALRERPSAFTLTTRPPGAAVWVDGERVGGATPLTVEVAPGAHAVVVRRNGYAPARRPFEAQLGRAVIVSLDLAPADK
jgi:hypothetical protein